MKQIYSNYTAEDFEVWSLLFDRQFKKLEDVACEAYIEGIKAIKFSKDRIPHFEETDAILKPLTGWKLEVVPNIIPGDQFFRLLNEKKFCATTWLRKKTQLDYLEEPDMFHDVFGHVPLLTDPHFCDFFHGLSEIALRHIHNPKAIELLGRIYWFTIEFGLIEEKECLKIYGAGILSSPGETEFSLSEASQKIPYEVKRVMHTSYRTDVFQERYFVIHSFKQLYDSLSEIENCLLDELSLHLMGSGH